MINYSFRMLEVEWLTFTRRPRGEPLLTQQNLPETCLGAKEDQDEIARACLLYLRYAPGLLCSDRVLLCFGMESKQ